MERKLPEPPPPVDAAVIARCVRRVEASRMAAHLKKPALWALQHPNQTNHAARSAHMHGRPGNPQLWSGTSLSMQAQWHKHKGTGFKSMCQKALVAAVACGAMVRWEASGVGFLYMPVRLSQQRACPRQDVSEDCGIGLADTTCACLRARRIRMCRSQQSLPSRRRLSRRQSRPLQQLQLSMTSRCRFLLLRRLFSCRLRPRCRPLRPRRSRSRSSRSPR